MFDYPHLFNSVRNTFLKNNFIYTDFGKMGVKFATQIMSNATASAIRAFCDDISDNLLSKNEIIKYSLPTVYFSEIKLYPLYIILVEVERGEIGDTDKNVSYVKGLYISGFVKSWTCF